MSMRFTVLENDTPLLSDVVAESVVEEIRQFLSSIGNKELSEAFGRERCGLVDYLVFFQASIYKLNADWRKKMKSARGRDLLYSFMRHWSASYLKKHALTIFRALPQEFSLGHELPR